MRDFDTPPEGLRRARRTSEELFDAADLLCAALEQRLCLVLPADVRLLVKQHFGSAMQIGINAEKHRTHAVQRELDEMRAEFGKRDTVPPRRDDDA